MNRVSAPICSTNKTVDLLQAFIHAERQLDAVTDAPFPAFADALRHLVMQSVPCDSFYFSTYDTTKNALCFHYDYDDGAIDDQPFVMPAGELGQCGPTSHIVQTGAYFPFHRGDFKSCRVQDFGTSFGDMDRVSYAGVHLPVFAPNSERAPKGMIGVFAVMTYATIVYDEEAVALLHWLADRIGATLQNRNARLENEQHLQEIRQTADTLRARVRTKLRELTTLSDAVLVAAQSHQKTPNAAAVVKAATTLRTRIHAAPVELLDTIVDPNELPKLSEREAEVLACLVRGLRRREIANELCLSDSAISFHLNNIYKTMGVASKADAVKAAPAFLSNVPAIQNAPAR